MALKKMMMKNRVSLSGGKLGGFNLSKKKRKSSRMAMGLLNAAKNIKGV